MSSPERHIPNRVKSFDKTALENCIFISKSLKGFLPSIFNNWFKFSFESHSHDTRWSNFGYLKIASYRTKTYGRYSMYVNSIYAWNDLQSCHQLFARANKLKEMLITFFLNRNKRKNKEQHKNTEQRTNLLRSLFRTFPLVLALLYGNCPL